MDDKEKPIILATRGSALALRQSGSVKVLLERALEKQGIPRRVEIATVRTQGDRDRLHSLVSIGGKGLFVRAIEEELLNGRADIAVHSAKDLPYELSDGLVIAGVPACADFRDCLLMNGTMSIEKLKAIPHSVIGTGSPRRRMELLRMFPGAVFAENRGNIPTRIRKLREGRFDAIVLAQAGLDRLPMDLGDLTVCPLSVDECLPAACQGILAVECRAEDSRMRDLLGTLSDPDSYLRFSMERNLFTGMKADCSMAVGAHADILDSPGKEERTVVLTAMYEGRKASVSGFVREYPELCRQLARRVMSR